MKSISFKISDELKFNIEELAKRNRTNVSRIMLKLIEKELLKGEAATTLYESDTELIKNTLNNFTEKGLKADNKVNAELADVNSLFYVPDAWLLEAEDAAKLIGANDSILKRLKMKDYTLVDKNHELMKKAIRSYNFRAKEKIEDAGVFIEKVFKRKSENPLILVEKLDPLKLSKFCIENSGKKVHYLFGVQDAKVNRQVPQLSV